MKREEGEKKRKDHKRHSKISRRQFMKLAGATGVALSSANLFGLGSPRPARAAKSDVLRIGSILNLTGPVAYMGPPFKEGILFALEENNYTVSGRKIEIIFEDAAADMNRVLERTKKLHEHDGVNIIIGPLMGDTHFAIGPYIHQNKVVASCLHSGSYKLQQMYRNFFNYPTTLGGLQIPLGYYAGDIGYKTMVTVGADYAGGHGFIEGLKLGFEKRGGKVVQQLWAPVGVIDYGPYITSLKKADVIGYFGESPSVDQRFYHQCNEFGVKTPILGCVMDGCMPVEILDQLGNIVLGIRGEATYVATRKDPMHVKWVRDFTKRFGHAPGGNQSNSYAITKAYLAALEATGGDDSYDKFWPALLDVKIDTPQGPLEVSPLGVAIVNIYIVEVKKKNEKYYWEEIRTYPKVRDPRLEA